ncbi:GNAT family N-acetyltransferase [Micromonospora sp. NBC_01412]|uniref:GNAT family N-acetyltransferase n=1 Tax=Micromonospora sp. NBC_01412 TaxID=2903590 RepID=UPI00386ED184
MPAEPDEPARGPGQNGRVSFLVEDNPARRRFEILVDDALAGFTVYLPRGEVLVFTHTEIDPGFQNMGVGSTLVRATLDQVRERGGRVVPRCPFMAAFIERHPEYADLVISA